MEIPDLIIRWATTEIRRQSCRAEMLECLKVLDPERLAGLVKQRAARRWIRRRAVEEPHVVDHRLIVGLIPLAPRARRHEVEALKHRGAEAVDARRERRGDMARRPPIGEARKRNRIDPVVARQRGAEVREDRPAGDSRPASRADRASPSGRAGPGPSRASCRRDGDSPATVRRDLIEVREIVRCDRDRLAGVPERGSAIAAVASARSRCGRTLGATTTRRR